MSFDPQSSILALLSYVYVFDDIMREDRFRSWCSIVCLFVCLFVFCIDLLFVLKQSMKQNFKIKYLKSK